MTLGSVGRRWATAARICALAIAMGAACEAIESDEDVAEQGQAVSACRTVVLEATKDYKPARWQDAVYDASPTLRFAQPGSVDVTQGNAGNKHITRARSAT